jgi:hypothetical protein
MDGRGSLLQEFEIDERQCFESGRLNNITDIALSIISVLTSLAATVLVSTGVDKAVVASVAALPAACTALQRTVDFRGRSLWYFEHAANITALSVSLRYATTPDLEQFAKRRAELEIDGDKRWGQIGRSGESPSNRRIRKKV